jgi:dihydroflavonol-4-reductase
MADINRKSRSSAAKNFKAPAPGDLICITGVSGFLGSHLVREALERGYRVRGTVRSTKDKTKTAHLLALPGAVERLELVEADLNDADPFTEAFNGCKYVLHSASPLGSDAKDPQKEIVDPAVRGVTSAMQAALTNRVYRLVITSSTAALSDERTRVFTEADWNSTSNLKRLPYFYSKTLAEKAGWDFIDQHKDDPNCPQLISILVRPPANVILGQDN